MQSPPSLLFPTIAYLGYAGEGASISINRLQPTASSVRCASASGRGWGAALGGQRRS
jgi:hypothetical protein